MCEDNMSNLCIGWQLCLIAGRLSMRLFPHASRHFEGIGVRLKGEALQSMRAWPGKTGARRRIKAGAMGMAEQRLTVFGEELARLPVERRTRMRTAISVYMVAACEANGEALLAKCAA